MRLPCGVNRLRQPLVNRNGKLESVSWAEALDHVAGRIKELTRCGQVRWRSWFCPGNQRGELPGRQACPGWFPDQQPRFFLPFHLWPAIDRSGRGMWRMHPFHQSE